MSDLAFALCGVVALFTVAVPGCTLVARASLARLRRRQPASWHAGGWTRYTLLVAPVIVPVTWFVSAAVRSVGSAYGGAGPGYGAGDVGPHLPSLLLLALIVGATAGAALWRGAAARRAVAPVPQVIDRTLTARLERLAATRPALRRARLVLVAGDAFRTVGLWSPVVEVGRAVASSLDDDALVAALLHEVAHRRAYDPLRYVVLTVCQALNPLGHLLDAEVTRWRVGREQACDREAVHEGGDPLALAAAIVTTARHQLGRLEAVGLSGHGTALIRERVDLLFGYVRSPPGCTCARTGLSAIAAAALALALLPQRLAAWPLLDLHAALERALASLFG